MYLPRQDGTRGPTAIVMRRLTPTSHRSWVIIAGGALCAGGAQGGEAGDPPSLADCGASDPVRVLQPTEAGAGLEARAVWLDGSQILWPGNAGDGRFRIYHSRDGRASAAVGGRVVGADGALELVTTTVPLPPDLEARFRHLGSGTRLRTDATVEALRELQRQQLLLVQEDAGSRVMNATRLQSAAALDALFPSAANAPLGARITSSGTSFALWAPTARNVALCLHGDGSGPAQSLLELRLDATSGTWSTTQPRDLSGHYYTYLVDVQVDGVGLVRNRVTDPYAVSLTTDSRRGYVADLDSPRLKPAGWDRTPNPDGWQRQPTGRSTNCTCATSRSVDATVRPEHRGKYLAFTERARTACGT